MPRSHCKCCRFYLFLLLWVPQNCQFLNICDNRYVGYPFYDIPRIIYINKRKYCCWFSSKLRYPKRNIILCISIEVCPIFIIKKVWLLYICCFRFIGYPWHVQMLLQELKNTVKCPKIPYSGVLLVFRYQHYFQYYISSS